MPLLEPDEILEALFIAVPSGIRIGIGVKFGMGGGHFQWWKEGVRPRSPFGSLSNRQFHFLPLIPVINVDNFHCIGNEINFNYNNGSDSDLNNQ